jgi:hypothetical protein
MFCYVVCGAHALTSQACLCVARENAVPLLQDGRNCGNQMPTATPSLPLQYMINRRALRPGNDAHKEEEGGSIFSHNSRIILACTSTARPPQPSTMLLPPLGGTASFLRPWHCLSIPCHLRVAMARRGAARQGKKKGPLCLPGLVLAFPVCLLQPHTSHAARPPGKNTASLSSRLSLLLLVFHVICIIYVLFCHRFCCDFSY